MPLNQLYRSDPNDIIQHAWELAIHWCHTDTPAKVSLEMLIFNQGILAGIGYTLQSGTEEFILARRCYMLISSAVVDCRRVLHAENI